MKLSKIAASLAALALGTVSVIASASTFVDKVNKTSQVATAVKVDFGTTTAGNSASGDVVFSDGTATFTDGALWAASVENKYTAPVGGSGSFWSVGISPDEQDGPGVLTFKQGVSYVGFLWGSPDSYNTVTFFGQSNNKLGEFSGTQAGAQTLGRGSTYFNFYADGSDLVGKVTFSSSTGYGNAFETDNFAYSVSAVPEPESYAMMLAGLGLMGFIARRRNKSTSI